LKTARECKSKLCFRIIFNYNC